jgi:hypothetical protein
VSLLVRVESTALEERRHGGSTNETAPGVARRWVRFTAATDAGNATETTDADAHYRLEAIRTVRGAPLMGYPAGGAIHRREGESAALIPTRVGPASPSWLAGAAEPKRSCTPEHEGRLLGAWGQSPWRVALLVAFRHTRTFWALPREQRAATYLGFGDDARKEARAPVLGRVIQRLYRGRNVPDSEWDYLAYFEMQPPEVAYVREYLSNLREPRNNPLWSFVDRETELWMIRQLVPNRS